MYKMIFGAKRKPGMSREDFGTYWTTTHANKARSVPGIKRYVINLAPDKPAVFREVARVLKPGGRLAVSDIALKKPLPPEVGADLMAYVGCIAGAIAIDEYRRGLTEAGFTLVEIVDTGADLNAYSQVEGQAGCCSPGMSCGEPSDETVHGSLKELLTRHDVNEFAASVRVFAVKPG